MSKYERLTISQLDDYFAGKKHTNLNMGDALINYMVEDSVNKIEAQFWEGLDGALTNKPLEDLLYRSNFKTERQQAGEIKGRAGETFVALIMINDNWYIQFFEPLEYEEMKTNVLSMTAKSGQTTSVDGKELPLIYHWEYNQETKRVVRNTQYSNSDKRIVITETYTYPPEVQFVPGKIIGNNALRRPDWYNVMDLLFEMNILSNEIAVEWENIKTMWRNVGVFGKGKQGETFQKEIRNGGRVFDDFTKNGQFAQQLDIAVSGSQSLEILIRAVVFHEDRILKYSFQGRDADGSGTNKHGLQVGLFNQAHSENVIKKKEQRENDYMRFFKDVVEPITGITAPKQIIIGSSAYEKGKTDAMEVIGAQKEMNDAQAEAMEAQAKKTEQDTKKVEKETTLLKNQPA